MSYVEKSCLEVHRHTKVTTVRTSFIVMIDFMKKCQFCCLSEVILLLFSSLFLSWPPDLVIKTILALAVLGLLICFLYNHLFRTREVFLNHALIFAIYRVHQFRFHFFAGYALNTFDNIADYYIRPDYVYNLALFTFSVQFSFWILNFVRCSISGLYDKYGSFIKDKWIIVRRRII